MVGLSGPIELWAPVGPYRMVGNLRPRSLAYRNQNNGVPYQNNGGGQIIVGPLPFISASLSLSLSLSL
jgi:hypothetical protein